MSQWLFSENLTLPSWMITLSITLTLALLGVKWRAGKRGLSLVIALDLAMGMMVSAFAGGRLFHIFYEHPGFYWQHPMETLKFWQGGFVYYGGLFLSVAALAEMCRRQRLDFWRWADFFSPLIAFTYALGRWGCFFNGCCYGRPSQLPWATEFQMHSSWAMAVIPRHPTQIYASILELLTLSVLLWFEGRQSQMKTDVPQVETAYPGQLFLFWLILHSVNRLVVEFFRDDDRGSLFFSFSISTWISVLIVLAATTLLVFKRNVQRTKSAH